eukprot:m.453051 g.453051  ORF g.453051 m.453051 type:complete len:1092 (+) comp20430_c0_seq1:169-3444(+)
MPRHRGARASRQKSQDATSEHRAKFNPLNEEKTFETDPPVAGDAADLSFGAGGAAAACIDQGYGTSPERNTPIDRPAPGEQISFRVADDVRYTGLDELEIGDRVRIRLSPPDGKHAIWVSCTVQANKHKDAEHPIRFQVASKNKICKWMPLKPAKFFGNGSLDIDVASVPVLTEDDFQAIDGSRRMMFDKVQPGASLALRVQYIGVVKVDGLELHSPDFGTHVQYVPAKMARTHAVRSEEREVLEMHISDAYVPKEQFVPYRNQGGDHPLFQNNNHYYVACYGFTNDVTGHEAGRRIGKVLQSEIGWSRSDDTVAGPNWCIIKVSKKTKSRAVDVLRREAPWCRVTSITNSNVGYSPVVYNPRSETQQSRMAHVGLAVRTADTPPNHLAVFVAPVGFGTWRLPQEKAVAMLQADIRALDGTAVHLTESDVDDRAPSSATVVSFLPQLRKLLVRTDMDGLGYGYRYGSDSTQLVLMDVPDKGLAVDATNVPLCTPDAADPLERWFAECTVCMEMKRKDAYGPFCYREFRISGDGAQMSGPRHPNKVCSDCLSMHCEVALGSGQLYALCPAEGCGRPLQTMELRSIVHQNTYSGLLAKLRLVEESGERAFESARDLAGLDLRACPQCAAAIEKNEGCSSMRCYRCGANFDWNQVSRVKTKGRGGANGGAAIFGTPSADRHPGATSDVNSTPWGDYVLEVLGNGVYYGLLSLPLVAAGCWLGYNVYRSYHTPDTSVLSGLLHMTATRENLRANLNPAIVNGTRTAVPWPHEFDQWVGADGLTPDDPIRRFLTATWGYATQLHTAVTAFAFSVLCLCLSPIADRTDQERSWMMVVRRVVMLVGMAAAFGLGPFLARHSDTIWEYGPAAIAALGEFILGHGVILLKRILFDHFLDCLRLLTFIPIGSEVYSHWYYLTSALALEVRAEEGSPAFWVTSRVLAPLYFGITRVAAEVGTFFTTQHDAYRCFTVRSTVIWDTIIEPWALAYDTLTERNVRGLITEVLTARRHHGYVTQTHSHYDNNLRPPMLLSCDRSFDLFLEFADDVRRTVVPPDYYGNDVDWAGVGWLVGGLAWCHLQGPAVLLAAVAATSFLSRNI